LRTDGASSARSTARSRAVRGGMGIERLLGR
jgi:hypothetical protein